MEERERMVHQEDQELRDQMDQKEIEVLKVQTDQLVDPEAEEVWDLQVLTVSEDHKVQWEWLEALENQENVDQLVTKEMMVPVVQQVLVDPWESQEMVD